MNPTVLDRLLAISDLIRRDMQRSIVRTNLTEARMQAMRVLFYTGPSPQRVLAQALGTTARSVSALVDGLEAAGYVRREPHPEDRRAVLLTLTDGAVGIMWNLQEERAKLSERLLEAVDPGDRAAFERGLNSVFSRVDEIVRHESANPVAHALGEAGAR